MTSISNAMQAYQQALGRIGRNYEPTAQTQAKKPEGDFGDMVKNAIYETQKAVGSSEKTSIQGLTGKADIQDVVLAVANAEQALNTLVTVRNSAVQAYQEIMRMNI